MKSPDWLNMSFGWPWFNRNLKVPLLALLSILSLAGPILFLYEIYSSLDFRNKWISQKYEGSLSEDLGFLTALTAELSAGLSLDSPSEQAKSKAILDWLGERKLILERRKTIESSPKAIKVDQPLQSIIKTEDLLGIISSAETLDGISASGLGLDEDISRNNPSHISLQTAKDSRQRDSFLFIPASLGVDDKSLSIRLKREIFFSEIIQREIRDSFADLIDHTDLDPNDIYQIYYIPFSGFIRVMPGDATVDAVDYYRDRFPPLRNFADRPYYNKTRKAPEQQRVGTPYIDVAGGGLIKTHSVFVNGPVGIEGIICVDQRLWPLADNWTSVKLGPSLFRDFQLKTHQLESEIPAPIDQTRNGIEALARTAVSRDPKNLLKDIKRFTSDDGKRIVFTVPLSSTKYGTVVFDEAWSLRNFLQLVLFMLVSTGAAACLFVLSLSIQRRHDKDLVLHSGIVKNLHAGIVVVDKNESISVANQQFKTLVGDPIPESKNLSSFLTPGAETEYQSRASEDLFAFTGGVRSAARDEIPVIISGSRPIAGELGGGAALVFLPSEKLELMISTKFMDLFSHALKTPIHSILQIAAALRRGRNRERFNYLYSLLEKEISQFKDLADNVLSISDIGIDVRKEPQNVARILRSLIKGIEQRARKRGVHVVDSVPGELNAEVDERMLVIVFNNILDNALKYTKKNGRIEVLGARQSDEIEIVFRDTGMGIRKEDRGRIFDRFFRGKDPEIEEQDGIGLGLFVCKKYIEGHGGTISCLEGPGGVGSSFVLRFPRWKGVIA